MSIKFAQAAKAAFAAAVIAPLVAGAASPSTTLYGGGATLPQIAYTGKSWLTTDGTTARSPQQRLTNPADAGSLFGAYSTLTPPTSYKETAFPTVSYCAIGSGGGRKVLYGASGFLASNACGDYTTSSKNGFSGANAEPNFAASDAPFAISEYDSLINNKGATHTGLVQIPSVAGAIAIVYANTDLGSTKINLTESQICQIFSGQVNNWNQISSGLPSKSIKIVYRSDDSGTSFNFTNHLSAVCPTAVPTAVSGFSTQSTFTNMFNSGFPQPAGSIGGSGNGGVVQAVQTNDGTIGYAEVQDAVDRIALSSNKIQFATVSIQPDVAATKTSLGVTYHKWDPTSLANRFTIPTGGVKADSVINGNDSNGRPVVASIASVTTTHAPTQASCIYIADPNSIATAPTKDYSKTNSAGTLSVTWTDYKSYPIAAVTYLLAYNTGNGADANNLKSLLAMPYAGSGGNNYNGVTTVGDNTTTGSVGTGFAYLSGVPTGFATTIKGCVKP